MVVHMTTHTVDVAEMESRFTPIEATAVATASRTPNGEWHVDAKFIPATITVDREDGYGWALGPKHATLAARLVRAINAGAVFSNFVMGTDVNGKTFIHANANVRSRAANADLRAIGF
jgi:hypothetical protein